MRWLTNSYDFSFKWTATPAIGIHPTKAWLSQLVNFKNAIWTWRHFRRMIFNKITFSTRKNATETYGMPLTAFGASCMNRPSVFEWHKRFKNAGSLWGMIRGVGGLRKSIHQSWLAKGLGLELLCWGFKGVQEEIPWEEANTLQIGSVAFSPGQCTSPQHNLCLRLLDQDEYQVSYPPYSRDLALCDFWLFPKLRGCLYETIEEVKDADTLTQEDFHGAIQRFLEQHNKCIEAGGDYFEGDLSFMCVLSIKVPARKKSGNLSYAPRNIGLFFYILLAFFWRKIFTTNLNNLIKFV